MAVITMADVAKRAGVSKSTVSQYLNKRFDYMGEKTKKRIEQAIEELDYSPNFVARSLRQKKTMTIGVIVANILHDFSTQVIRAIEDACHEQDFHVIVCNADDEPVKERRYIEMLRAKQVDGIIVFPTSANVTLYNDLLREGYPLVFVDRMVSKVNVNAVISDNEETVRLAVGEFVAKGYERIAMVLPSLEQQLSPRVERMEGYKKALAEYGLPYCPSYLASGEIEYVQPAFAKMIALESPPQALLAGNDLVLFEVLEYAKREQMRIPEDIAIIGIDDVSFANFYNPSLTTVAQPTFEMGKKAAELLLKQIKNGESSQEEPCVHRFQPTLKRRSSS
ncbi:LacI family DNA-binding transcriptional regulator [Shouchella shacheensis]|uniref:LacI family DNA-binding transcriptional regulator n=1 Tax=Shouchella shacheensis TaxID=1649580 RepID=UPI000740234F|nr:substrate-binding domain-containing protein [Shouchella shacheensis]